MAVTCKDYLLMNDSVAEAKRKFQASPRISLPLLDGNGNLHGVVWCKDLLDADNCQPVSLYCSHVFLQLKPMMSDRELLRISANEESRFSEAYIVDDAGVFIDSVDLLSMMNAKVQGLQIETEEEFIRQILRPTSLARCILDGLNDGVVLVDCQGLIHYANQAYGKILGVNHRKVINRLMTSFEPQAKIMEVIASGTPLLNQTITVKSVGITVLANITPVFFANKSSAPFQSFPTLPKCYPPPMKSKNPR